MSNDGKKLESDFADFMKKKLGFNKVAIRERIKGKVTNIPIEVDVHGIKENNLYRNIFFVCLYVVILSILSLIFEINEIQVFLQSIVANFVPDIKLHSAVIVVLVVFLIVSYYFKTKSVKHVWVECKDHLGNVKRKDIEKLISESGDAQDSIDVKWKPDELILVSGSGFDDDVYNFADEYDIMLYKRKGKSFVLVDRYGNH
ncbi:MAG: hypothetical protein EPN82_08115 [Bacteroidetes bacterium]|nr:MAG: hypothetical protein EPN82_08115 [Bacteroidota bacterium]